MSSISPSSIEPSRVTVFCQVGHELRRARQGDAERAAERAPRRRGRDLTAGPALDVGCGDGADAIWLAVRGWTVTAISPVAVAPGREAAELAAATVAARQDFPQTAFPARSFHFVTLQYPALPNAAGEAAVPTLLDTVRPGGSLLAVDHDLDDEHREHMKSGRRPGPTTSVPRRRPAAQRRLRGQAARARAAHRREHETAPSRSLRTGPPRGSRRAALDERNPIPSPLHRGPQLVQFRNAQEVRRRRQVCVPEEHFCDTGAPPSSTSLAARRLAQIAERRKLARAERPHVPPPPAPTVPSRSPGSVRPRLWGVARRRGVGAPHRPSPLTRP
jgi:SAM-dependent methyltransferase